MLTVRRFYPELETKWLTELWNATLSGQWSLAEDELRSHLFNASLHLVAERDGRRLGFIAAIIAESHTAVILAILVERQNQRQGIGSALLERAQAMLSEADADKILVGSGGPSDYFWPGVPTGLHSAWPFFERHGWRQQDRCSDLLLDLRRYGGHPWIEERLKLTDVHFEVATRDTGEATCRFEREHFPAWLGYYASAITNKQFESILLARKPDGRVIGSAMLTSPGAVPWMNNLGGSCGGINVLGVAPVEQGRGIGMALADRAATLLRERGCSSCLIGWTDLVSWYGKLGAKVWSEYRIASKRLSSGLQTGTAVAGINQSPTSSTASSYSERS